MRNIKDFLKTDAPEYCGVHPSWGDISILIHESELEGLPALSSVNVTDKRLRCEMHAPYGKQADEKSYEQVIDVLEFASLRDARDDHGEDGLDERINELSAKINKEDPGFMAGEKVEEFTRGWWSW
jgi:hypothetical protein